MFNLSRVFSNFFQFFFELVFWTLFPLHYILYHTLGNLSSTFFQFFLNFFEKVFLRFFISSLYIIYYIILAFICQLIFLTFYLILLSVLTLQLYFIKRHRVGWLVLGLKFDTLFWKFPLDKNPTVWYNKILCRYASARHDTPLVNTSFFILVSFFLPCSCGKGCPKNRTPRLAEQYI